ncbi:MAG: sugar ABC transporter ATP-binding protein [Clostridiales bacterium]|jgi:ABC-type sugar transport system ATPase subunit|nr:sugar ABC transporter ATP-binding protein [Clostridiales bacterium]
MAKEDRLLLEMSGISKSFSGVRVLDDVSFDLRPSEIHVLAGENGAGKTTLIKILSGAHTEYQGKIFLEGKRIRLRSPQDATSLGISAIHQDLAVVDSMRVLDNLFLGREKTRHRVWMDFRSQKARARKILEPLGISLDLEAPLCDYPISVRQMVEVAKALASKARILIMDEPTSALNETEADRLFSLILRLKQQGCAIVYISHRLEEIFRIADRITVLRDGRLVGTVRAEDLSPEELIRWMVGREIRQQFPERRAHPGEERLRLEEFFIPDPSGKKSYVVEDVSLRLRAGEILGLAGLRGSGKSELLNGLFGTYGKNVQGRAFLDNKPFRVLSPRHSIEQGLALQTNDRKGTGLVPGLSVAWNIILPSLGNYSPHGWVQEKKTDSAARKKIEEFDIKVSSPDQEVGTLSGGNQQKVVLAKWLQTQPKVLLLDEPTLGVDVGAKHEIYHLMNNLTAKGLAILLVTSELPELLAMSDRLLVLHRGRVQAELSREEATQENVIRSAMGEGSIEREK